MEKVFIFTTIAVFSIIANIWPSQAPDPLFEESINWLSWEEAVELNANQPKKLFIDVYTDWCGYCKKMDRTTFMDQEIIEYLNSHFYAIKLDAEMKNDIIFNGNTFKLMHAGRRSVHSLAYSLLEGKMSFPSYITMDENFSRIAISPGYKFVTDLLPELKFAAEEKYKTMSWQEYSKAR